MTVYVDDMCRPVRVGRIPGRWSHLFADERDELHEFAVRLGLKRSWFQDHPTRWHYDVTDAVRAHALKLGAQPMSYPREVGMFFAARLVPPHREG